MLSIKIIQKNILIHHLKILVILQPILVTNMVELSLMSLKSLEKVD